MNKKWLVHICIFLGFVLAMPAYGNFFNNISEKISQAGDAAVDGAKELGEGAGIIEKNNSTESSSKTASTVTAPDCEQWAETLNNYCYGDKKLNVYLTEDKELISQWKANYLEAKPKYEQYTKEVQKDVCNHADSLQKYLKAKIASFEEMYPQEIQNPKTAQSGSTSTKGKFVFSTQPIEPGNLTGMTDTFTTGQNIYGLVHAKKTWSKIYGKKKNVPVRVDVKIDGKKIHAQFVTLKSKEYAQRDYLIFNIAPEISNLVAYTDQNLNYGKTTAVIKQGPNELSHHLGKLSPGKHTVYFEIQYYGKKYASGQFSISGNSYDEYTVLHEKIAKGVVAARTLPDSKLNNAQLESEMKQLLSKAGWKNVYRLNIVDKDWWTMRASGGNSAVVGRYIDAAAISEEPKGNYYYKRCSFQQDIQLSGNFGPLFISKQGEAVPMSKNNIDK